MKNNKYTIFLSVFECSLWMIFVTERKEIVCPPFYLPLNHSMHTVGISAMFRSLQPTSSLGVGKHELVEFSQYVLGREV